MQAIISYRLCFHVLNMCKWLMNDYKITKAFLHLKTFFKRNEQERDYYIRTKKPN